MSMRNINFLAFFSLTALFMMVVSLPRMRCTFIALMLEDPEESFLLFMTAGQDLDFIFTILLGFPKALYKLLTFRNLAGCIPSLMNFRNDRRLSSQSLIQTIKQSFSVCRLYFTTNIHTITFNSNLCAYIPDCNNTMPLWYDCTV